MATSDKLPPSLPGLEATFTISSGLPPLVGGPLLGEVQLCLPALYLKPGVIKPVLPLGRNARQHAQTAAAHAAVLSRHRHQQQLQPPQRVVYLVRVRWWGEAGPGTILKPREVERRQDAADCPTHDVLDRATCALFPVRADAASIRTYLEDMGHLALDILAGDGTARQVGRCVLPLSQQPMSDDGGDRGALAHGAFPVLAAGSNVYAGELRVRLRVNLGPRRSALLRCIAAGARASAALDGAETERQLRAMGQLPPLPPVAEDAPPGREVTVAAAACGGFSGADWAGLDASRGSLDSAPAMPPAAAGAEPSFSFQLNEALTDFDDADVLPVWPTPSGRLYAPPEAHGEAIVAAASAAARSTSRAGGTAPGRTAASAAAGAPAAEKRISSPERRGRASGGRGERHDDGGETRRRGGGVATGAAAETATAAATAAGTASAIAFGATAPLPRGGPARGSRSRSPGPVPSAASRAANAAASCIGGESGGGGGGDGNDGNDGGKRDTEGDGNDGGGEEDTIEEGVLLAALLNRGEQLRQRLDAVAGASAASAGVPSAGSGGTTAAAIPGAAGDAGDTLPPQLWPLSNAAAVSGMAAGTEGDIPVSHDVPSSGSDDGGGSDGDSGVGGGVSGWGAYGLA
ncbi:unnamed protein product, partial [Phaeothamnion confervicola]